AELGVPIGVLEADWGGTPAEAWTRAEGLERFPEFSAALQREALYDPHNPKAEQERLRADSEKYWKHVVELDAKLGLADAAAERCDESSWSKVTMPATWEQHGLADFDGIAWYRRTLDVPAAWAGKALVVELGAIDDRDTSYWNGARIGGQVDRRDW